MCSFGWSKVCWMRRSAMPGMRRIWFMMRSARSRLAATFLPTSWTSIGRGQPEVEDLADDVVGQKVEVRAWKFPGQAGSERAHELFRGAVVRGERDHDVGIGRAHRRRVAVNGVNAAVGQADLVQDVEQLVAGDLAADGFLHQVADAGGLFDAGPGLGAQMQLELARCRTPGRNPGRSRGRAESSKGKRAGRAAPKTTRRRTSTARMAW